MPGVDINDIPDDLVIENQQYVCITYVPHLETNTLFFKIRGSYSTQIEAHHRATQLQAIEQGVFPIYVGEVGKFMPGQSNLINLGNSSYTFDIDGEEGNNPHSVPFNLINDKKTVFQYLGDSVTYPAYNYIWSWVVWLKSRFIEQNDADIDMDDENIKELTCLACMVSPRNIVCLPCRHFSLCLECSKQHIKKSNKCPMCRKDIVEMINVFT